MVLGFLHVGPAKYFSDRFGQLYAVLSSTKENVCPGLMSVFVSRWRSLSLVIINVSLFRFGKQN